MKQHLLITSKNKKVSNIDYVIYIRNYRSSLIIEDIKNNRFARLLNPTEINNYVLKTNLNIKYQPLIDGSFYKAVQDIEYFLCKLCFENQLLSVKINISNNNILKSLSTLPSTKNFKIESINNQPTLILKIPIFNEIWCEFRKNNKIETHFNLYKLFIGNIDDLYTLPFQITNKNIHTTNSIYSYFKKYTFNDINCVFKNSLTNIPPIFDIDNIEYKILNNEELNIYDYLYFISCNNISYEPCNIFEKYISI
jgi:hypothetical protein